jgi:hypothetical protein
MKEKSLSHFRYQVVLSLLAACALLLPQGTFAASTGTTALFTQWGRSGLVANGDYVSCTMYTYYSYWIEVPASLNRLRVRIYDSNVTGNHDVQQGGSWNTSCIYTLIDPGGTPVATFTRDGATGTEDDWDSLYDSSATPITAGHWELRVNTSASGNGDDLNGYGISADNGDETSAGTELNVYAHSFVPLGMVGSGSITTTMFPYITSGCTADWNDFDGDNGGSTYCRYSYASRNNLVSGTYNGSGNNAWLNRAITGYSTDNLSIDSGIWRMTAAYTDLGSGGNFGVFWAGNWLAANGQPSAQPQANSFRIYLPTDGGGAPAKPYLTQKIVYVRVPTRLIIPPIPTHPLTSAS